MIKSVFITGHTSGLGQGLKQCFADNGYEVFGLSKSCANDERNLNADLHKLEDLNDKLDKFLENKKFDICFLNAGILGEIQKATNIDKEDMLRCFSINVISTKIIIDAMIRCGSCNTFISISSGASNRAYDGWLNYCISKSSLRQMISCYAIENKDMHFISLAPGIIKTKMQDEIIKYNPLVFSSIQKFKDLYDSNPTPIQVSKNIFKKLNLLLSLDSGSFIDLREISNDN